MEPRSLLRLLTMISSREELERTAIHYGILPFFANHIPEFSVQEMAAPGMLFADNPDEAGCWEWKGPVIREQTTAYGKFFRRKAGFVAVGLLPDFINYRRAAYPVLQGSIDEKIMHLFNSCDGLSSTQIKHLMKSNRIESPLQRLQMGTWINIADFEYKISAAGHRYGWGVAVYTTPEQWFSPAVIQCDASPMESFHKLCSYLSSRLPDVSLPAIEKLLR